MTPEVRVRGSLVDPVLVHLVKYVVSYTRTRFAQSRSTRVGIRGQISRGAGDRCGIDKASDTFAL